MPRVRGHMHHLFTGELGSISSATTSLICASVRMPAWPKRGMFEHALYASAFQILPYAYFWMSGIAAQLAARARQIPTVQTFHGLGVVKRRHHEEPDTGQHRRLPDRALAEGPGDEVLVVRGVEERAGTRRSG